MECNQCSKNPSKHAALTAEEEAALETAPQCASILMWCKDPLLKASLLVKRDLEQGSSLEIKYTFPQNMITRPVKCAGQKHLTGLCPSLIVCMHFIRSQ